MKPIPSPLAWVGSSPITIKSTLSLLPENQEEIDKFTELLKQELINGNIKPNELHDSIEMMLTLVNTITTNKVIKTFLKQ